MKVFISWSGTRSKAVALVLREWLQDVIQNVEPWMSAADVKSGTRWSAEIAAKLEQTKFGIICLTKENSLAPWINFEAGALAKTMTETFVCPYLIDISPSDIPSGPLTQFQAVRADKDGTRALIQTLNSALGGEALAESRLDRAFEKFWDSLDEKLKALPHDTAKSPKRPPEEMMTELVDTVRKLKRQSPPPVAPTPTGAPQFEHSMTVAGTASEIQLFTHEMATMPGYISKEVKPPDVDGCQEIIFSFINRVPRDTIIFAGDRSGIKFLMRPVTRQVP